MSRDIFSKDFKPYISRTKGFWTLTHDFKKVYIPTHYSYCDKYSVRPINFKSFKDRQLYKRMKEKGRVFKDD